MKMRLFFFAAVLLASCKEKKQYKEPHVIIDTNFGEIEAELYPDKAPKSVAAFLSYVDAELYKDASFYRVVKTEDLPDEYIKGVVQGGVWKTNNSKMPAVKIEHESTKLSGLSHTNGILSLARTTPGTASSEFFICIGDQVQFDAGNSRGEDTLGFAAFGKVVKGMDAVKSILLEKNKGDAFINKIAIKNITRL